MALIDRLKTAHAAFWASASTEKALTGAEINVSQDGGGTVLSMLLTGVNPAKRGTKELLAAYTSIPWLRAVAQKVAVGLASVEWELYAVQRGSKATGFDGYQRDLRYQQASHTVRAQRKTHWRSTGALQAIEQHPLLDLLNAGCPQLDGRTGRQVVQTHYDLKGEGYYLIERTGKKDTSLPVELWPIPPHWIETFPTLKAPTFTVALPGAGKVTVAAADMLQFRDPDPLNPYARGTGLAESLNDELDTSEYTATFMRALLANHGMPPGIVSMEGAGQAQLVAAQAAWMNQHGRPQNAGKTHFTNVKTDYTAIGISPTDMNLIQQQEYLRNTVIQVWGVPPEIFGIASAGGGFASVGADFQADAILAKHVLLPRLEVWRAVLQAQLVPQFDERLIIDYVSPVPDDREFALKVMVAMPATFTQNEWRDLAGEEATPDGEVYLQSAMLIRVPATVTPEMTVEEMGGTDSGKMAKRLTRRKAFGAEDVDDFVNELDAGPLVKPMTDAAKRVLATFGARALHEIDPTGVFDIRNPSVAAWLRTFAGEKVVGINTTTQDALREALGLGVDAGEGIPDLKRRIRAVMTDASSRRAETIAHTEVVGASNFSIMEGYRQSSVVERKRWISTRDDKTRDSHAALDGVIEPLDGMFETADGNSAEQPGGFGVAEEDINCRCTVVAVVDDPVTDAVADALWKVYDADLRPHEQDMARAARTGFAVQTRTLLAALDAYV